MKRLFGALVTVALGLALFASLGVRAAAGPDLTVSDASGTVGSEVVLNVVLINNPGFDVLECAIEYDTSRLRLESVSGCVEGEGKFYNPDGISTAFIYFGLIFSENGAPLGKYPAVTVPEAPIACLTFKLLAEGEAEVRVRALEAMSFDSDYNTFAFSPTEGCGRVSVLHSHTPSQNKIADERLRVPGSGLDCRSFKKYYFECASCHEATEEFWVDTATGAHCFGDYVFDEIGHRKVCICGSKSDEGAHTYDGEGDMLCNECSYDRSCRHKSVLHVLPLKPTCTAGGNIEYWYCEACGELFDGADPSSSSSPGAVLIPALGHTFSARIAVAEYLRARAANCTERDSFWYSCAVCGEASESDFFEGDRAGIHIAAVIPETPPTCTQNGKSENIFCRYCSLQIKKPTVIPARGHLFGDWVTVLEPTESENGSKMRICSNCGAEERGVIPALPAATSPAETTAFVEETTLAVEETTVVVEEITSFAEQTTEAVEVTTSATEETTEKAAETTVITEQTTAFEEESTAAAELPPTGDESLFFIVVILAIAALLPLAAFFSKKESK